MSTPEDEIYAQRLYSISNKKWKRSLKLLNPYRLHIRYLIKGSCLDVGAGFGRNLGYLNNPANHGIEPNPALRRLSQVLGHSVVSAIEASSKFEYESFDNLLFSHVLEHLTPEQHLGILDQYLPYLKSGGRVVVLIPQEAGFKHDSDHKFFWTPEFMAEYLSDHSLILQKIGSFPLPSIFSRIFIYNEWFLVAAKK
jgi:SAM-dependent methyltransferase